MEIGFDKNEAALLKRILSNYLGELRMEVSGTESYDMRESLKKDEAFLKDLIGKLEKIAG